MVTVMLMSVVLIAGLCVLAYTLAVYALPFMLGFPLSQNRVVRGSEAKAIERSPSILGGYELTGRRLSHDVILGGHETQLDPECPAMNQQAALGFHRLSNVAIITSRTRRRHER